MPTSHSVRGVDFAWEWSVPPDRFNSEPAPVIWAHGGNSSRTDEDALGILCFDTWSAHSRRGLLRYDARGHGASSDSTDSGRFAWDELARDQLALADAIGIAGYTAGGRSLGAATSLHAAVLAPERVEALVLMTPPSAWEERDAQADRYVSMAARVEAEGIEFIVEGLRQQPLPGPLSDDPRAVDQRVASLRRLDSARFVAFLRGTVGANLPDRSTIASIQAPTLIFAWTEDPGHPVAVAEELDDLLPNSTLRVSSTQADYGRWTEIIAEFANQP